MKFAQVTDAQAAELRILHKSGKSHRQRQRAQAVLLSARGMSLDQLAFVFECDRDTVSDWLDDWQSGGVQALADAAKSGRPSSLDNAAQSVVLQAVSSPTPNFKGVLVDELKKGRERALGHGQTPAQASWMFLSPRPARAAQNTCPGLSPSALWASCTRGNRPVGWMCFMETNAAFRSCRACRICGSCQKKRFACRLILTTRG